MIVTDGESALDPRIAKALLAHFKAREDSLLSLIREFVEIESPSGSIQGNRAAVDFLVQQAQSVAGVEHVERVAGASGEHFRLRAFGPLGRGRGPILLLGHTDTVHPEGSLAVRPWREEDGRIYAPGIYDMKANCILALEALRAVTSVQGTPPGGITLLLTCDEETGSEGGRALVEQDARNADHVLVLEPSGPGGSVKTTRKGTGMYFITAEGMAAHAGLDPEKGASAILEMSRQIQYLAGIADQGKGTNINVGVVCGGTRSNVVAAQASAEVDVRFSTSDEARRIESEIMNLTPFDKRVSLKSSGGINRPPLERTEDLVRLYQRARGISRVLGVELFETSVGGASDGNFAAAVGATVLDGLGIQGSGAHSDGENILREDVGWRGAFLAALLAAS